jgi:hypothetical protein
MCVVPLLVSLVLLGGCSGHQASTHTAPSPAQSGETPLHAHGSTESKLGLQPAVIDGVMEATDVAVISHGALVGVDVANVIGALHGTLWNPTEQTVLFDFGEVYVAWSGTATDYPVKATIAGPVDRVNDRLRMTKEQFAALFAVYFPHGKFEVKDDKLIITTGR